MTNQMKATDWCVPGCGTIYYAEQGGSNFQSVDEIIKCDHSNESS